MSKKFTNYVLGFMFGRGAETVLLIRKNHPEFMKNKFNGIGGEIAFDESELEAMVRTCSKETGIETSENDWEQFATLQSRDYKVSCFVSFNNQLTEKFPEGCSYVKEEFIKVAEVSQALTFPDLLEDLKWLIPFAMECEGGEMTVTYS
ncbi:MAG: hypothetical protein K1X86_15550 [Ignavibacteria bacterium]|nr:hypothetical protein [Ignavibacteria bacterium]